MAGNICYTTATAAAAGSGACGSWCTHNVNVGVGCGEAEGSRSGGGSRAAAAVETAHHHELSRADPPVPPDRELHEISRRTAFRAEATAAQATGWGRVWDSLALRQQSLCMDVSC